MKGVKDKIEMPDPQNRGHSLAQSVCLKGNRPDLAPVLSSVPPPQGHNSRAEPQMSEPLEDPGSMVPGCLVVLLFPHCSKFRPVSSPKSAQAP